MKGTLPAAIRLSKWPTSVLPGSVLPICCLILFHPGEARPGPHSQLQKPQETRLGPLLANHEEEPTEESLGAIGRYLGSFPADGASQTLEKALELTDSAEIHGLILGELHRRGLHDRGRTILERLDRQSPESALYLGDLVRLAGLAGDWRETRKHLREAARRFPDNSTLHTELGLWLYLQKSTDLALAELLRAQQAGLKDSVATLLLATLEAQVAALRDAISTGSSPTRIIPPSRVAQSRGSGPSVVSLNFMYNDGGFLTGKETAMPRGGPLPPLILDDDQREQLQGLAVPPVCLTVWSCGPG